MRVVQAMVIVMAMTVAMLLANVVAIIMALAAMAVILVKYFITFSPNISCLAI